MDRIIYLDNHATTPVDPRVVEAMLPCFGENFGNPSSHSHRVGLAAEKSIEVARRQLAALLGASPRELIFTGGASEGNNLVLRGVVEAAGGKRDHLVISAVEHKCVLETARYLARRGCGLTVVPVGTDGRVDPDTVLKAITPRTALVSVIMANNEIGSINPVREIGAGCRERGVPFHTDAAQAVGKMAIDLKTLPVDFLTGSAHKFYGPKGIGFLYLRQAKPAIPIEPLIWGGGQEAGLRSGTHNVPGIVGLGRAAELAREEFGRDFFQVWELRNGLHGRLAAGLGDRLFLNGPALAPLPADRSAGAAALSAGLARLPGNLNFGLHGLDRDRFLRQLRGLALSYGSACASGDLALSHVLKAIGLSDEAVQASLRAGIGRFNTPEEIDTAAAIIVEAFRATSA
jgi:cysteine desulfurase